MYFSPTKFMTKEWKDLTAQEQEKIFEDVQKEYNELCTEKEVNGKPGAIKMLFKPPVRSFISFYEAVNDLKDHGKSVINSKLMIEVLFDYETKDEERKSFENKVTEVLKKSLKVWELKVGVYRGEGHPLCDLKGKGQDGKDLAIKHNALK